MGAVRTVTGMIDACALGFCQIHEHLYVSAGPATQAHPALLIDDEALSGIELARYVAAGGGTVVDCQPGGAGRNAQALCRMSKSSGAKIVCVTGYHLPFFYPENSFIFGASQDELTECFTSELLHGIVDEPGAEPVYPGAVKAALSKDGCVGKLAVRLRAAARSAAHAKVPLLLHTEKGAGATDAIELCQSQGLSPQNIIVCHADRQADDYAPHERIAQTGALLDYDTIGRFKYHDDESELRLILHMIERGYAHRLLLSLDTTRERLSSYGGSISLNYLIENFLPKLRQSGVSEADIRAMTSGNAQRAFS